MRNTIFKAEKFLGKIGYSSDRKINAVTLEGELREVSEGARDWETLQPVPDGSLQLSICGNIWNNRRTDCDSCGQNLDTIAEYIKRPSFKRIRAIWEEYHLNDMNAGTKAQTEAVRRLRAQYNLTGWHYDLECDYLKTIGLYNDRGYKYGCGWLYNPMPVEVIKEIVEYFGGEVTEQMRLFIGMPAPCECPDTRPHSC